MQRTAESDAAAEMRQLVVRAHERHRRDPGELPVAAHALSVAEILDDALAMTGELRAQPELHCDLYLAALGHDLYQETTISATDVRDRFGVRVDQLIGGLTIRAGEHEYHQYVARIGGADEEVRLIKLADLIENVVSCACRIDALGDRWVRKTFLLIAEHMFEVVSDAEYARYPRTSALLASWLDFAMRRLRANLAIARALAPDPMESADRAASKPWDGRPSLDISAALRRTREREWRESIVRRGAIAFPRVWAPIRGG